MIYITKIYLLGVDLAKTLDFTSFAVVEMEYQAVLRDYVYHLRGLDRIQGVDYPIIVELIKSTISLLDKERASDTRDGPHLCMDASGLGAPIRDYLKKSKIFGVARASGKHLYPVVFTGGEAARRDAVTGNYNISKSLIVGNFLSLMQHRRFDFAPDLQALPLLEQEIASFKRHTSTSGRPQFDAVEGAHDDLICAICIPLIIGEWLFKSPTPPLVFGGAIKPAAIPGSAATIRQKTGYQNTWFAEAARHHNGGF